MKNFIVKHLFILILCSISFQSKSQYSFEWSGVSPQFENGVANLVSYIDFGEVRLWGFVEISLSSDYNYQNTTGLYRKTFNLGRNFGGSLYSNTSEVSSALGPVANQWKLGDFEVNAANHLVVPIYHLASSGNAIYVHVKGISTIPVNTSHITIPQPVAIPNTQTRDYNYINDKLTLGTWKADPDALLTVAGRIHSREVKVSVEAGADFVFEKNYDLEPLASLAKYISHNKHLPGIASAEEMKKKGLELGEMNIKLLQKIEELTLHLIEQNRINTEQNKLIQEQSKRIEKLEKR